MSSGPTFQFKKALKAAKTSNKTFRNSLKSNKSVAPGIKMQVVVLMVEDGTTPKGNVSKEATVQVMVIDPDFPSSVASYDTEKPGVVNARMKEKAGDKWTFSNTTTPVKPGDIFKVSWIDAGQGGIPAGIEPGKLLRLFSVAPRQHRYKKDTKYKKAGELATYADGTLKAFWKCANSVEPLNELEFPGKVIGDLQKHVAFNNFTLGPERPFRYVNGNRAIKPANKTLCFGGHIPEDAEGHFVVNAGVTDPDNMEYLKEGQSGSYMAFGATVLLFQWYKHTEPRVNWDDPAVERELWQQTAARFITNERLLSETFLIHDKAAWSENGPHFARGLEGLVVVKDPYDSDPTLSNKIQEYAESIEFDDGGSDKAREAIESGNAVKRGTVVTISKMMLNLPSMIRKIGTQISLEQAEAATNKFAAAKQLTTDKLASAMQQNVIANPHTLNVIGLHSFTQSTSEASLRDYDIYIITPNEDFNGESGKSAEEVMAEVAENEERSKAKKTFDPDLCLYYAVHRRTLDTVQDALAGVSAEALDMDIEDDAGASSSKKRDREEDDNQDGDDDLFGDTTDMEEPPKKKKKKNKSKTKSFDE